MDVHEFAQLVLAQTRDRIARMHSEEQASWYVVQVIPGPKYTKVDLGVPFGDENRAKGIVGEGKFMIENATGVIYGIKGYGKVHKGHMYGTLDTVDAWYWGDYYPVRRDTIAEG